jgi:hypothetical protein
VPPTTSPPSGERWGKIRTSNGLAWAKTPNDSTTHAPALDRQGVRHRGYLIGMARRPAGCGREAWGVGKNRVTRGQIVDL